MFHPVNGDRRGHGRRPASKQPPVLPATPEVNKGDRGFSDRHEARVFLIGRPAQEQAP